MNFPRAAGVLLHPTFLPGANGIGELGVRAHRFPDTLAKTRVNISQMLPLGPTGYGDSPCQVFSAFAGNPLLIAVTEADPTDESQSSTGKRLADHSIDGFITPEIEELRARWGYPGMCILQFAFGTDAGASAFRPHTFPRHAVVSTGAYDNDTVMGWWQSAGDGDSTRSAQDVAAEKQFAMRYLDATDRKMHWAMIRAAMASACDTAIVPMQDLLGQGSEARMNLRGRVSGN